MNSAYRSLIFMTSTV